MSHNLVLLPLSCLYDWVLFPVNVIWLILIHLNFLFCNQILVLLFSPRFKIRITSLLSLLLLSSLPLSIHLSTHPLIHLSRAHLLNPSYPTFVSPFLTPFPPFELLVLPLSLLPSILSYLPTYISTSIVWLFTFGISILWCFGVSFFAFSFPPFSTFYFLSLFSFFGSLDF